MLARELKTNLKMYIISNVKLCKSFTFLQVATIYFSVQCIFRISAEF